MIVARNLNSDYHLTKKLVLFASMKDLKGMKNGFYFFLKALFFVKIFKVLS